MARQRSHSIEFKRQVAQEFAAGETLYALASASTSSALRFLTHDVIKKTSLCWAR